MRALINLGQLGLHVVAQVIKAKLVVGGVGHVTQISGLFLAFGLLRINNAGGHAKRGINLAHPLSVAFRKIVVHGHDMHALARQRVQVGRESRNKGFTLTCLHLRDVTLMQENATHKLRIKSTQTKRTARGLAAVGKCFWQHIIEVFTTLHAGLKLAGFLNDTLIRQSLKFWLQRIDLIDQWTHRFHFAVIGRAKHLFGNFSETQHIFSDGAITRYFHVIARRSLVGQR